MVAGEEAATPPSLPPQQQQQQPRHRGAGVGGVTKNDHDGETSTTASTLDVDENPIDRTPRRRFTFD